MMGNISRRQFLKYLSDVTKASAVEYGTAGGLSALTLAAGRALASPTADPAARFILFRIHGAMDSTLGLHPWLGQVQKSLDQKDLFLTTEIKDYKPKSKILGTQISLGPAAEKISAFSRQMAIVRGIIMGPSDLGHPFAMQHITSGRTQESAPSWTSYVGSQQAKATSNKTFVVTNAPLLIGALAPFPVLLTSVLRSQIANASNASNANMPSGLSAYANNADLGVTRYLDLLNEKEKLSRFMDVYRGPFDADAFARAKASGAADDGALDQSTTANVKDEIVALASLYSGISNVAQIDIDVDDGGHLDTHIGHGLFHAQYQAARWNRIAAFLERLKTLGMLENTLVVVVTEFNRTPGLNNSGGKDHNYADNAVALFGRNVNGGTVIGDRRLYTRADGFPIAYWSGSHIDFGAANSPGSGKTVSAKNLKDGAPLPEGVDLIRPADIWASIIHSLDEKLIASLPDDAKVIPRLFIK